MNFPFEYGVNTLLLNNLGEGFLDSEFLVGIEPRMAMLERPWYDPGQPWLSTKKPWFELDCSGPDRSHMMCRGRPGKYVVMGNVGSRSAVIFDLDNDGDLDIVTNEYNDVPQVLISDLAQRRPVHFVKIELVGTESNRDGLGAQVEVEAGPLKMTKQNDGKSGYLSQSSMPLYFGLGDTVRIDRITIRWPSGREQVLTEGLVADSLMTIEEQ
jgi:hypothetical protein